MSKLNDITEQTKGVIHLMVTTLCNRNCPHCCNKQYNLNDVAYVTDEELKNCHTLFLTGGEPFLYSNPNEIAKHYKRKYPNIEKVIVYTNAVELYDYIAKYGDLLDFIDGVNISIKTPKDWKATEYLMWCFKLTHQLKYNRIYNFLYKTHSIDAFIKNVDIEVINRDWQSDFEPANDSIFRKV